MEGKIKTIEVKRSAGDRPYLVVTLNNDKRYYFWESTDISKNPQVNNSIKFETYQEGKFIKSKNLTILNQTSNSVAASNNSENLSSVLNRINETLIKLSLQLEPISNFFKKISGGSN